MHPDEESNLRAAFGELHRRQREQSPPFEVMRERAMRQLKERPPSLQCISLVQRLAFAAVAVCVAVIGMWWIGQLPRPATRKLVSVGSTVRVNELIAAIEQHVERSEPLSLPEFPTDTLLAEHESDFSQ
jgi:hypothetical protein